MGGFTFRKMKESDVHKVSLIHTMAFKNFFLTSLGINFLSTYYRACIKNTNTIAYCTEDQYGNMIGFVTGCDWAKGYHKTIFFNNILRFGVSLAWSILKKPTILLRLAKNMEKNSDKADTGEYAELLSIGVNPEYKGSGVGRELLNLFHHEVKRRGGSRVVLTTDKLNNEAVLGFYKKAGYEIFYEFTTYPDREMYKLMSVLY